MGSENRFTTMKHTVILYFDSCYVFKLSIVKISHEGVKNIRANL